MQTNLATSLEAERAALRGQVDDFKAIVLECCDNVSARRKNVKSVRDRLVNLSKGTTDLAQHCATVSEDHSSFEQRQLVREARGFEQLNRSASTIRQRIPASGLTVENCQTLVRWLLTYQRVDEESANQN